MFRGPRILTVLLAVNSIATAVRLSDVASGFASLVSTARAETKEAAEKSDAKTEAKPEEKKPEEKKDGKPADKTAAKDSKKTGPVSMESDTKGQLEFPEGKDKDKSAGKSIDWQAASDVDVAHSDVRQELYDDLNRRKQDMDKREKDMTAREALLEAAEREIDRKYQELTSVRQEIEGLLQKQSEEEQARVVSLVKIYEGMKPKDAARIFDTLDIDVLVSVMGKMSERKLSPILAAMNAERARTMTIMLAEQKKLPELPSVQ